MKALRQAMAAAGIVLAAAAADAQACGQDYFEIEIDGDEVKTKRTPITKIAKDSGGFRKLAERDAADRKTLVEDNGLSADVKRQALPFIDENIKAARCWAAGGK